MIFDFRLGLVVEVDELVAAPAEGGGGPALDGGVEEIGGRAVVERGDGGGIEETGFGLLIEGVATSGVGERRGFGEEAVVVGVVPAGPVVAAGGGEEAEEVGGVGEVGKPGAEGDRVIAGLLVLEPRLLFAGSEGDADAEFALPGGLNGFGVTRVDLVVAALKFEDGKIATVGMTGIGEEFPRGVEVGGDASGGGVAGEFRRGEREGGGAGGLKEGARKGVAVDRERKRAADAGVVEWGAGGVEAEEVGLGEWVDAELSGSALAPIGDLGDGQVLRGVDLAGAEVALIDVGVVGGKEDDRFERDGGGLPVVWVFADGDVRLRAPVGEGERAAADEIAGAGPVGAAASGGVERGERARIENERGDGGGELGEPRGGAFEGDDDGAIVGRGDAELGEIGGLAGGDRGGVLYWIQQVGVVGGESGRDEAAPGRDEVGGEDGFAVGPAEIGAKMECPREAVGGGFPTFGGRRDGLEGLFVEGGEAFEEGHVDIAVGVSRHELRIEIGGLGGVAEEERVVARGFFDGRFARGARREQRDGKEGNDPAGGWWQRRHGEEWMHRVGALQV